MIVSFEVAKLARERGFSEDCLCYYNIWRGRLRKNDISHHGPEAEEDDIYSRYPNCVVKYFNAAYSDKNTLPAPTQDQLRKWLREEHNLHVDAEWVAVDVWDYAISTIGHRDRYGLSDQIVQYDSDGFSDYEQALEVGLKYALELC